MRCFRLVRSGNGISNETIFIGAFALRNTRTRGSRTFMGFTGWNLVTYERFFDIRRNKILFKSKYSSGRSDYAWGAPSSLEINYVFFSPKLKDAFRRLKEEFNFYFGLLSMELSN